MAHYFVGDIQGCFAELKKLLATVEFNPSKDQLWAVGDLVARGPGSLAVLRFLKDLEGSAKVVLGNHDLHLLSLHNKIKKVNPKDNLDELLHAADIAQLIDWLRLQPLHQELEHADIVMTHAGVPPLWGMKKLRRYSASVSTAIQRPDYVEAVLSQMYTQAPAQWSNQLSELEIIKYTINALTRMRYLYPDGRLDFDNKLSPTKNSNPELTPWFAHDIKLTSKKTLVFGHWAALMGHVNHNKIKALDTGCCWGKYLSLWHLETDNIITQDKL